jgi:hypothetical protein
MSLRCSKRATTSNDRNVFAILCLLAASGSQALAQTAALDARDIIKQSLAAGERNAQRSRGYISRSRVVEKQIDANGSVRSEIVKGYETLAIDGVRVRKLVTKNDKPLPADEARNEDERIRKIVQERRNESSAAKAKRLDERKKNREKEHEFNREILDAFYFKTVGEETIAGRKNWVIEATPRPGYEPKEMRAKILSHLKGKVWIDQEDKLWTKVDAVGIDPFSLGFGIIAKLEQGAHLYFEQTRLEDGTWVMRQSGIRATAHVAMVKRMGIHRVSTFHDYRKVPSGSEVDDSTGK